MLRRFDAALQKLMLAACAVFLTGCATTQQDSPASVVQRIPPLPAAARQPERPAICLPSCPQGLQKRLESLLNSQMAQPAQGDSANGPTMR